MMGRISPSDLVPLFDLMEDIISVLEFNCMDSAGMREKLNHAADSAEVVKYENRWMSKGEKLHISIHKDDHKREVEL